MQTCRDQLIGKTIANVIMRPAGKGARPAIVMLQFDDGSCYEFVSSKAKNALNRSAGGAAEALSEMHHGDSIQLPQLMLSGV